MQSSTSNLQFRNVKWALLFFFFVISFIQCKAQPGTGKYSSSNKSAVRDYEDGKKQYDSRQDVKAIKLMESAIRKDTNFIEAWMVLGQIYLEGRDNKSSLEHYRKVVQISPSYLPGVNMLVGDLEMKFANYENAKVNFENYINFSKNLSEEAFRWILKRSASSIPASRLGRIYSCSPLTAFTILWQSARS